MALRLRWKGVTTLPVEGDVLRPGGPVSLTALEFARLTVAVGTTTAVIGELFHVETAEANEEHALIIEGDLRHVRGIGRGMERGTVSIEGEAGAYLGAGMTGGRIDVSGGAGSWAGAEMRGGLLQIRGNAGRFLGASLPGSRRGMNDGVILVHGSVGDTAGRRMRRGLIAVKGAAADYCGKEMIAGSIFVFGSIGQCTGSGMKRGTIGLFGSLNAAILSNFATAGRFRFPFMTIILRWLLDQGFPVPLPLLSCSLERYNGDLARGGQGEILVAPRL